MPAVAVHADGPAAFVGAVGTDIRHGGMDAYYNHRKDFIRLPEAARYESPADYARSRRIDNMPACPTYASSVSGSRGTGRHDEEMA